MSQGGHNKVNQAAFSGFEGILFEAEEGWLELPRWTEFAASIGWAAGREPLAEHRMVAALIVPTRAYAASFAALGVAQARAGIRSRSSDPQQHLELLRSLPAGTPVTVRRGDLKYRGVLVSASLDDGADAGIRIQIKAGTTLTLPPPEAHRVAIAPGANARALDRLTRRRILANPAFCRRLLPDADPVERALSLRLDCLAVGRLTALHREWCDTHLAVRTSKRRMEQGTLQDALRARAFLSTGQAYASEVVAASRPSSPDLPDGARPHAVVFDGATGFLRWRHTWRRSHWVVVLDRYEPRFEEAVQVLNEDYVTRRLDRSAVCDFPPQPRGVEVSIHHERLR